MNCIKIYHTFYYSLTVLLEYINLLLQFAYSKYIIYIINLFPIMLALCLMLSVTHYAQNYAGIIGGSELIRFLSPFAMLGSSLLRMSCFLTCKHYYYVTV